jgi:O-antigen ligase
MDKLKDSVLKYGILAVIFLTPVVYFEGMIISYITSHTFFFYGFANILIGLWLYCVITDKSYRLDKRQLLIFTPLFLYIIWMAISGILAVNPSLALWSSLMRGTGLLTLFYSLGISLVISTLVKRNGVSYFILILKSSILASFFVAISVWLGDEGLNLPYDFFMKSSGGGLIGNSSLAATYLIFSLFFGSFLLLSKEINKGWRWFTSLVMVTIIFSPLFIDIHGLLIGKGILGTARGAVLAIIIGVVISILFYLSLSKNKIIKIFGVVSIFISLFIFSITWVQLIKPNTTLHNKFVEVTSENRFLYWDVAQKSIDKHPYFGYGPENYILALQENFNPIILNSEYGKESRTDKAHNIYFDTGISGGYPAILFYFLFLLSIFYSVFIAFRKEKITQIQASVLGGLLVAYIIQNLFVFDSLLSIFSLFIYAGLFFGLFIKDLFIPNNIKLKYIKNDNKVLNIYLGLVLLILFSISLYYFVISPIRKVKLFKTIITMDASNRALNYEKLIVGSPVGNDLDVGAFAYSAYVVYSNNINKLKEDKIKLPIYEKEILSYIDYLDKISQTNKTDYTLIISKAYLYNTYVYLSGKNDDINILNHMLDTLQQAHKISPLNPEPYWVMAQVYAWQGNLEKVEEVYKTAIDIGPGVRNSYELLLRFADYIGDKKLYSETLEEAQKNIPNFKLE